jgi:ATP-dependent 26S proteasome regulatory subunit
MDGLREDSEVLFILTTNRPDQIEPALVSRPGRSDQAIEFPLPDEEGRAKLTKLYARDLQISDELLALIVRRTKGVSAAFIKELMRRSKRCSSRAVL